MTREEFMEEARKEIDQILISHKNRLMNIVARAWAEGKRNAENERVDQLGMDILESLKKKLELDKPQTITVTSPEIGVRPIVKGPYISWDSVDPWKGIPTACKTCTNHPLNGGSGVCHCTLGVTPVMCSTSATGKEVLDIRDDGGPTV